MRLLIDTNVLVDFVSKREPFTDSAEQIFALCLSGKESGFVAGQSIPDAFYILRKTLSETERRAALAGVCQVLSVVGVDNEVILKALKNVDFRDFEDCLQDECALVCKADYIITRNIKDFANSSVKAITPDDFLELRKDKTE